ncbi:MAG: phosphopantetheine-binding protein [Acidobacteriota bacterium]|nr:phosphopantetheine-binding protein [Acidobacteriota bacterium]
MKPSLEAAAQAIYAAVAEVLEIETVRPEDNFIELGGNSLLAVVLANSIEEEFGTRPDIMDIFSLELHELTARFHEAL